MFKVNKQSNFVFKNHHFDVEVYFDLGCVPFNAQNTREIISSLIEC